MRTERKVNLSDVLQRAILAEELSQARGWHTVSITPARAKATAEQFGYFYAVVLPLAKAWLCESQGEDYGEDEADEWLKGHLRGKPVIDKRTGEQIGTIAPSKATFDITQMAEFVDDVIDLLTRCGVTVPPADKNWKEHMEVSK